MEPKCYLLISLLLMAFANHFCHAKYDQYHGYERESVKQIVKDIMGNLTLKGKIGQMTQLNIDMIVKDGSGYVLDETKIRKAVNYGVGSFLNSMYSGGPIDNKSGLNATEWISLITNIQTFVMQNTPQNISKSPIPMIYGLDSVHGANYVYGAAMFPHNTGMAATFDPKYAYEAAVITAKDTRAAGVPWAFSPVLGLGVNPLWPRIYETFGEDPFVASVMGSAAVRGLQGTDISDITSVAACAKHFLGYPAPKSGKDRTPAWIPDRQLYRYFVPSFHAGIEAGVETVMINSGEINGVPVHASHYYLTKLLRKELGFKGLAVTDWGDIEKLTNYHHVAATPKEAVKMAINAGVDMSMVPGDYTFCELLYELVEEGEITEERINHSVERILTTKVAVGLMTNPYPDQHNPYIDTVGCEADRNASLNAARESVTLLKNEDGILPIPKAVKSILVTGPCGDSLIAQNGGWSLHWQGGQADSEFPYGTTIYQGIKDVVAADTDVQFEQGVDFDKVIDIQAAVSAAEKSDIVILCLGEGPEAETPGDINDLTLSQPQLQLMSALTAIKVPVVLVLIEARPRILTELVNNISAVLMAFLPSSEGGQAIAEILFGVVNPSGKLPLTYPQYSGDVGVPYYKKYSDTTSPLFEFGTGLSYTTFEYSNLELSSSSIAVGEPLGVYVDVQNTGSIAGKEVVMVYVSDVYASVTPEVKMLKAFTKEYFGPGEQKSFKFTLQPSDFSFIGINDKPTIEPGLFLISVGNLNATVTLTGSTWELTEKEKNFINL